ALCPLQEFCCAKKQGIAESLPVKKKPAKVTELHHFTLVVYSSEGVFLQKGKGGKVMQDLWEFPFVKEKESFDEKQYQSLPKITHHFTRYRAHLYPYLRKRKKGEQFEGFLWKTWEEVKELPFSSGHRKLLNLLTSSESGFISKL
ncbi:MAG: NUDIX domain-containing protein, partial [Simkaniaceae bacterium]|nr:NUDIX domain-containing protein [Simkaniaceae bacterium]